MINIAINGFGRIGRSILRASLLRKDMCEDIRIVAINDIHDWEILSYLLEQDSTHGALGLEVKYSQNTLEIEGLPPIHTLTQSNPNNLDFAALGADMILESSGKFLDSKTLAHHCKKGIKQKGITKVMLCTSPTDGMPTFALGVNHTQYSGESIFSNASCTANALAPLCKILNQDFGIELMSFCITHSYTNEQSLLDSVYPNDKRRSRAAAQNIIPTSTGASGTLIRLLPELKGKIAGHSVRVPVPNILLLDITLTLSRHITTQNLHQSLISAAQDSMKGIIDIDYKQGVSSDFIGNPHSVVFVPDLSYVLNGKMARIMAWCDNEWGYANRVLDMARFCVSN
ncbi:type I glyceraldehyde-3-phosphate dehydrogenase [Helicobacter cinaedi]|uniref:type I glyceraldehyde-3-phosphate dehydrogenase n=1 Tax=Helicobacter cinaedi TaxID=213 RepID=UPI0018A5645E|nr:glyceraldehyde 3-phosphate dehydrogenase NAD-binding domain-containing protein [Helicobacter cinaedi]QOQ96712.1 type I glyceraldehyde-3-phosphate dehydrogenase [Helicobacter cinaedi]